jgi:hypothetical protein
MNTCSTDYERQAGKADCHHLVATNATGKKYWGTPGSSHVVPVPLAISTTIVLALLAAPPDRRPDGPRVRQDRRGPHWRICAPSITYDIITQQHRNIHRVAVQVRAIGNGVTNVDTDPKANGAVRRLAGIEYWNLLLHLHGTAHGSVDAVKHDEQRVSPRLDDLAPMFVDRGVD